jgi:hypothetical protein
VTNVKILLVSPSKTSESSKGRKFEVLSASFTNTSTVACLVANIRSHAGEDVVASRLTGISVPGQTDAMAPSSLLSSDCGVAEGDLLLGIPRGWTAEGTSEWSDAVRESGELSKLVAMAKPASPPNMRPDSSSSLGEKLAALKLRARSWSAPPAAAEERAPPQERAAPETNSDDDSVRERNGVPKRALSNPLAQIPNMSSPLKTTTRLSVGDLTPAVPRGTPGKARRTPRTTARATPGKAARMTPSGRALSGRKAGDAPASGRKGRGKGGDGRVEV